MLQGLAYCGRCGARLSVFTYSTKEKRAPGYGCVYAYNRHGGATCPMMSSAGIDAATSWRKRAMWHPELALTRASARKAYTSGAAYAAGMEDDLGSLRPGKLCDLTVVDGHGVVATVAGGRLTWRRKRA